MNTKYKTNTARNNTNMGPIGRDKKQVIKNRLLLSLVSHLLLIESLSVNNNNNIIHWIYIALFFLETQSAYSEGGGDLTNQGSG